LLGFIDRITWVVGTLNCGKGEEIKLGLSQYEELVGIVSNAPSMFGGRENYVFIQ
jgi:hypothetical protein